MDSYRRQGGLDYVRMFVTATTQDKSNESSGFIQQLSELEHYYPDLRDALEGRFWRLCRLTATQEDWLRGFLLDSEQRPLSASRMAARLHLSLADMKKTLNALKRVGLIEQVACPEFVRPQRKKSADSSEKESAAKRKRAKKSGPKREKKRVKAAVSKRSETFENVSESLNNKIESKKNNKETNLELEEKQNQTNQDGQAVPERKETTLFPTTAPSVSSTSPDVPGVLGHSSRRIAPRAPDNCEPIGAIVDLLRFRYDKESLEFADEIMVRMGFMTEWDITRIHLGKQRFSPEQANERAHWAKAWCECKGHFDSDALLKFRDKIFRRAEAVRESKQTVRNPQAYLMTAWSNLVRDQRRKCKAI